MICVYFNPRSHERSDFIGLLNYNRLILFQSTLPREERPFSFKEFFSIFYFNPRSHERSDSFEAVLKDEFSIISIHAPTRGATKVLHRRLKKSMIFQSTLPREERRLTPFLNHMISHISIHAPTRGATKGHKEIHERSQNFNPRSHERSDTKPEKSLEIHSHFNPRSHERSDGSGRLQRTDRAYFNPRSHERSDCHWCGKKLSWDRISIHAPTRGATAILHKKFVYFYTIPTINI